MIQLAFKEGCLAPVSDCRHYGRISYIFCVKDNAYVSITLISNELNTCIHSISSSYIPECLRTKRGGECCQNIRVEVYANLVHFMKVQLGS